MRIFSPREAHRILGVPLPPRGALFSGPSAAAAHAHLMHCQVADENKKAAVMIISLGPFRLVGAFYFVCVDRCLVTPPPRKERFAIRSCSGPP